MFYSEQNSHDEGEQADSARNASPSPTEESENETGKVKEAKEKDAPHTIGDAYNDSGMSLTILSL